MRVGPHVLGIAMLMAMAGCGSSAGSDAAPASAGGPKVTSTTTIGTSTSTSSDRPETTIDDAASDGGTPAATSIDDVCSLLDADAIQAAFGGASAEIEPMASPTPAAAGCYVAVDQPAKVAAVGPGDTRTSINVSIYATARSEKDFEALRPPRYNPVEPATKQAYWENDDNAREITWFDSGVLYRLAFESASDEVDGAKGFAILDALSKDIIASS